MPAVPGSHDQKDLLEKAVSSVSNREYMLQLVVSPVLTRLPSKCICQTYFLFTLMIYNIQTVGTHRWDCHLISSFLCARTACNSFDSFSQFLQSSYINTVKEDL